MAFRTPDGHLPAPWDALFGPLRAGLVDDLVVVGQLGQSLDGRIATNSGHSHYINGPAGLDHLHRLRALVDAVVIGVGTALADDPLLTVRRVAGPNPARVILDPRGRLPADARVLTADGTRRLVVTGPTAQCALPDGVEVVALPADDGHIAPAARAGRGSLGPGLDRKPAARLIADCPPAPCRRRSPPRRRVRAAGAGDRAPPRS